MMIKTLFVVVAAIVTVKMTITVIAPMVAIMTVTVMEIVVAGNRNMT